MLVENRLIDLLADKMKRERRVIPMAEVAKECGMSRQNISKWFNNHVKSYPTQSIAAFCTYFNCTPGDLIVISQVSQ